LIAFVVVFLSCDFFAVDFDADAVWFQMFNAIHFIKPYCGINKFSLVFFDNTVGVTIDTVCQPQTDPFYDQGSVPLRILKVEFRRILPYNIGPECVISGLSRKVE
jgi:hypothetical protein